MSLVHFLSFSYNTGIPNWSSSLNSFWHAFVGYILRWLGSSKVVKVKSSLLWALPVPAWNQCSFFSFGLWSLDSITSCMLALWWCGQGNQIFSTVHLLSSAIYVIFCGRFCHHRSYFPFTTSDLKGHRFCFLLVIQGSVRLCAGKETWRNLWSGKPRKKKNSSHLCLVSLKLDGRKLPVCEFWYPPKYMHSSLWPNYEYPNCKYRISGKSKLLW